MRDLGPVPMVGEVRWFDMETRAPLPCTRGPVADNLPKYMPMIESNEDWFPFRVF